MAVLFVAPLFGSYPLSVLFRYCLIGNCPKGRPFWLALSRCSDHGESGPDDVEEVAQQDYRHEAEGDGLQAPADHLAHVGAVAGDHRRASAGGGQADGDVAGGVDKQQEGYWVVAQVRHRGDDDGPHKGDAPGYGHDIGEETAQHREDGQGRQRAGAGEGS